MDAVYREPTSKKFVDLTGRVFGKLTVTRFVGFDKHLSVYECNCECGTVSRHYHGSLQQGNAKSCGCTNRTVDGQSALIEYRTWRQMITRCTSPKCEAWKHYGGRGIQVCERWLNSFDAFLADMGPRPSFNHSIDRINNDGNYEPDNCRWATWKEQANNRRNLNEPVTFDGVTKHRADWARHFGISRQRIDQLLDKYPVEIAFAGTEYRIAYSQAIREMRLADNWVAPFPAKIVPHVPVSLKFQQSTGLSHAERAERRKEFSRLFAAGVAVDVIANLFNVTTTTVRAAATPARSR